MPSDASERAFKIFTDAYGKAWSPQGSRLEAVGPAAVTEAAPAPLEAPVAPRVDPKRRLRPAP